MIYLRKHDRFLICLWSYFWAGLLFWAGGVLAAAPSDGPIKGTVKKKENHQFSDLRLKGQLKKPELSYIYKRKGLRSEKIVNVPENFNEEIIQGAGKF